MKRLKLILATVVAVFATFVGGKALAYDITVNNGGSGTYESYQIFTGDLSEDTLSNVKWGNGITAAGQTALQNKYNATSAAELAEKLSEFSTSEAEAFAKEAAKYLQNPGALTGLVAGYYLVQNKTVGENEAYTNYILEVVKDVTVTPKTDIPTVEKKVKDTNDTTGDTSDWQDSADHDINDKVPFQLTATLPANYDTYNSYYLNFSDELSAGLTFNNDAKVYVVNGSDRKEVTNYFYVAADGSSFAIKDLKQIAVDGAATVDKNSKIVVEYTATLNENAVIGSKGNPNTVKLIYSNNPNNSGDGNQTPGTPPTTPPTPPTPPTETGKTPKDTVIVFTYKTVVNKVDQNNKALAGAAFALYKIVNGQEKLVKEYQAGSATSFEFTGLDDGDYVLKETKTPAGYNSIADVTFTVTAEHDILSDNPALTSLSGTAASGELTFTADKTAGSLTTEVTNKKGSILPSTGSVGTTLLYLVGAALVVAAGVLLVTKKRMEA
ncbi:MAG: isopeptide-forming domain-containing fimbrial protein [Streptococcus orisratti]|uniref:isopeptide-forming domain-containing fimbrial protein n=1 Tax=Streptococcus orisratti TaxID=114652 RepID=UPI002353894A|nr:isopeptide-forming domain-containing fimbrial protein [Streptococcus orisratti]MCI7678383.1 isopeptide-forming domain-containing fimbrial protein [Streptococcus orisratti]